MVPLHYCTVQSLYLNIQRNYLIKLNRRNTPGTSPASGGGNVSDIKNIKCKSSKLHSLQTLHRFPVLELLPSTDSKALNLIKAGVMRFGNV